jgi:hypothetical protein
LRDQSGAWALLALTLVARPQDFRATSRHAITVGPGAPAILATQAPDAVPLPAGGIWKWVESISVPCDSLLESRFEHLQVRLRQQRCDARRVARNECRHQVNV